MFCLLLRSLFFTKSGWFGQGYLVCSIVCIWRVWWTEALTTELISLKITFFFFPFPDTIMCYKKKILHGLKLCWIPSFSLITLSWGPEVEICKQKWVTFVYVDMILFCLLFLEQLSKSYGDLCMQVSAINPFLYFELCGSLWFISHFLMNFEKLITN